MLWTAGADDYSSTLRPTSVDQTAKPSIHQLYAESRCRLDLPRVIAVRDKWQERKRESKESVLSACIDKDEEYKKYVKIKSDFNKVRKITIFTRDFYEIL